MTAEPPSDLDRDERRRGFHIALVLILGAFLLMLIPILGGDVQGGKDLAAIFSGWIAAIIGFYFFQGQAEQAAAAAEVAERQRASEALRDMAKSLAALEAQNARLQEALQKALNRPADYKEVEEA